MTRNSNFIVTFSLSILVPMAVCASEAPTLSELQAKLKKNPNQIVVREQLAKMLHEKKEDKKAIDVLAAYSNDATDDGLVMLAEIYDSQGNFRDEIRTLQMFQTRRPDRFRPYFLLGEAFHKNKQDKEAVENYRLALQYAPKHEPSYRGMLDIATANKNYYESRTILTQMVRTFGPRADLLTLQCKLFADGGFLAEAEKTCRNAIAKDRKVPENHVYLAQALFDSDRKQAAENVFRNAARQFNKSELVQYAAGYYYFGEKNYATAVRYLTAAVALKNDSARSHLALAQSLYEADKPEEALPHFQTACKLDKTRETYNELRSAAARLKKFDQMRTAMKYDSAIIACQ